MSATQRWLGTSTGAIHEDTREAVRRMRSFYRADQALAGALFVVSLIIGLTTVDSRWNFLVWIALAVNVVFIEFCYRRINEVNVTEVSVISVLSVWLVCLAIAPVVSFALPALVMVVSITMLAVVPLLTRPQVIRVSVGAAILLGLIATLAYSIEGPIDEQIPDAVGNLITTFAVIALAVPLGTLAWDIHVRQTKALTRMADANDALRESRARLVDVADEERRKIERNLHDGAQQRFVALTLQLRLLSRQRPEIADDLAIVIDELQEANEEVRTLAHGIYPPLLRARGLSEALSAAARRSPLNVTVQAETTTRYSQRIEVAVYFCCLEALQNAGKYGGEAVNVTIDLVEAEDVLTAVIQDDGPGFDPEVTTPGQGLRNMADRLSAVNAELDVTSSPGNGTRVATVVELPAEPTA